MNELEANVASLTIDLKETIFHQDLSAWNKKAIEMTSYITIPQLVPVVVRAINSFADQVITKR
jgi:hypothetical protein